ncbi:MAG TPA: UDP-N-acetylmuramoyl-L-alanyl-D-glutamate--2,6-diaminopimelate ligase [Candidatus Limiplasma sp.]|nr:UDP-N-acetylmuramoyl-L-alanyl-D-glutamate--2,6-diaminopimelate ligase [Candidatus Limiplasma sp.]
MMLLKELIASIPDAVESRGNIDIPIEDLSLNSRDITHNGLFFCISGARVDAHDFAPQAIENGCVALVVSRFIDDLDVPQIKVGNVRSAMAYISSAYFGYPSKALRLIGISGTKGKTTTTYLLKSILEEAGYKVGLIGTTGNMIGNRYIKSVLTTPDSIDLHRTFRDMVDEGVQIVCMEVSAHAIDMHRIDGLFFEAACYTNLSQDHLDYFHTMEQYFLAKKKFFTTNFALNVSLNLDEETSKDILADLTVPYLTYGIRMNSDLYARDIEITENGIHFLIQLRNIETIEVSMQMTGMFNVYNALAAASVAMIFGVDISAIRDGLHNVKSVPGRIELLDLPLPFKVILDYSHSPDALENILTTVRTFTKNRLIVLFGCGGDRDQGKRPIMGEIGGRLADFSILTSDNPRTEDPDVILEAIEEGMKPTSGKYIVIENRREAIRYALDMAQEGDIVILAGKGHETYQDIMGVKRPFDEKVVVKELIDEKQRKA